MLKDVTVTVQGSRFPGIGNDSEEGARREETRLKTGGVKRALIDPNPAHERRWVFIDRKVRKANGRLVGVNPEKLVEEAELVADCIRAGLQN